MFKIVRLVSVLLALRMRQNTLQLFQGKGQVLPLPMLAGNDAHKLNVFGLPVS